MIASGCKMTRLASQVLTFHWPSSSTTSAAAVWKAKKNGERGAEAAGIGTANANTPHQRGSWQTLSHDDTHDSRCGGWTNEADSCHQYFDPGQPSSSRCGAGTTPSTAATGSYTAPADDPSKPDYSLIKPSDHSSVNSTRQRQAWNRWKGCEYVQL